MPTQNAAKYDQLITLQQPTSTQNATGQPVQSWATVAQVWAKVQPLRGREFIAAQAAQSETLIKAFIRWRADVRTTWRILWGDQVLHITAVIPVGARQSELELHCTQGVPL